MWIYQCATCGIQLVTSKDHPTLIKPCSRHPSVPPVRKQLPDNTKSKKPMFADAFALAPLFQTLAQSAKRYHRLVEQDAQSKVIARLRDLSHADITEEQCNRLADVLTREFLSDPPSTKSV